MYVCVPVCVDSICNNYIYGHHQPVYLIHTKYLFDYPSIYPYIFRYNIILTSLSSDVTLEVEECHGTSEAFRLALALGWGLDSDAVPLVPDYPLGIPWSPLAARDSFTKPWLRGLAEGIIGCSLPWGKVGAVGWQPPGSRVASTAAQPALAADRRECVLHCL